MKRYLNQYIMVLLSALLIPLSACATDKVMKKPGYGGGEVKFSVDFRTDGTIVVRDRDGRVVKPGPLDLPLEVKAIVNIHSIVEAKGSCYVIHNGRLYRTC